MYLVVEDKDVTVGHTIYRDTVEFTSLNEAKECAIRKAAKSKGFPECIIYTELSKTKTDLPTEVTVTINA